MFTSQIRRNLCSNPVTFILSLSSGP